MSMANTQVLHRYAHALYELASAAGEVDRVADELAVLRGHVLGNEELRLHLGSPRLTRASKQRLLLGVMGMDLSDLTRRVISLLVDKGRAVDAADLGPVFTDVAMVAAGRAVAQVTSATPLELTFAR